MGQSAPRCSNYDRTDTQAHALAAPCRGGALVAGRHTSHTQQPSRDTDQLGAGTYCWCLLPPRLLLLGGIICSLFYRVCHLPAAGAQCWKKPWQTKGHAMRRCLRASADSSCLSVCTTSPDTHTQNTQARAPTHMSGFVACESLSHHNSGMCCCCPVMAARLPMPAIKQEGACGQGSRTVHSGDPTHS